MQWSKVNFERNMPQYHWYIILVRGGQEAKLIERIKSELIKKRLKDQVRDLKVFNDENKKNFLKGYIFCYCFLTPELVRFFYSVPRVVSFLNHQRGSAELPEFVSPELIENFSLEVKEKKEKPEVNYSPSLNVDDLVRVTEGVFAGCEGKIISLDERQKRVKIDIDFAGKLTSIDVPMEVCQKVCY
jgi:transcription termination/antitermination protein NusG